MKVKLREHDTPSQSPKQYLISATAAVANLDCAQKLWSTSYHTPLSPLFTALFTAFTCTPKFSHATK